MTGKLFIVGTPIGNLGDITLRAIETMKSVDLVLCEDTRMTRKLLSHYEIGTKTETLNAHATDAMIEKIVEKLEAGQRLAMVSDAGMPTISDPGNVLVHAVLKHLGTEAIEVVPGPSALDAAIARSGFPGHPMTFFGFPPMKKGRMTFFKDLQTHTDTVVFYESTHRLIKALSELTESLPPERLIAWCRELTKFHEETVRGTAVEVLAIAESNPEKTRGEHVIVIAPAHFTLEGRDHSRYTDEQ